MRLIIFLLIIFCGIITQAQKVEIKVEVAKSKTKREYVMPKVASSFVAKTFDDEFVFVGSKPWNEKRLIVLHFWASWCPPCREEFAELVKFADSNPDLKFIAVSLDGSKTEMIKFLNSVRFFSRKHRNIQMLYDNRNSGIYASLYNLVFVPNTFLINRDGKIFTDVVGGPNYWMTDPEIKQKFRSFRR